MVSSITKSSWVKNFHKFSNGNVVINTLLLRWSSLSCKVERLDNRALLRVSGSDAPSLLQGIMTNDMCHLEGNCLSLYTMFLNTKGRVLYDSIIYKTKKEDTFLIECDKEAIKDLEKHIKMYKLRKSVTVDAVDDEFSLWALFNPEIDEKSGIDLNVKQEIVVPCSPPSYDNKTNDKYFNDLVIGQHSLIFIDPRLSNLGARIISPSNEDVSENINTTGIKKATSGLTYRMFRYKLGIAEGVTELPVGKCFPLEVNCDYLHGVSFHKGCYIGQELTARTHHTGVVRKRLMPLLLNAEAQSSEFPIDTQIESYKEENKKVIGKLRGIEKNCGLGLMRIAEAIESGKFKIGNVEGETFRPFWWPQELPKERVDSGSSKRS